MEPVANWDEKIEPSPRRSPTPPPPAWRDRTYWRWALAVLVVLVLAVVLLREPLATWFWPDTRVHRLLSEGEAALLAGHLSAADGSGARQRFEAAQALDSDRVEARAGLARVAAAALDQAEASLQGNRFEAARQSLALARELQVPRQRADAIAGRLRVVEAEHAGLDALIAQAKHAEAMGESQLALRAYQRVLALQPTHTVALESREDLLSEQLQRAGKLLGTGELAAAATLIAQARELDPGHVELPEAQAQLARAIERQLQLAETDLRRKRLDKALSAYQLVLQVSAENITAKQGVERVAMAYAAAATRAAADFRFDEADVALAQARVLAPRTPAISQAEQALLRARQSQSRLVSTLPRQERARRVQTLLAAMAQAEARADWLTPPGESAYDKLRAAQALAPDDKAVKQAAARFLPSVQSCFENELRGNRIRRAQACQSAWQAMAPTDAKVLDARRRLAQKWIAVGDERLGAGDVAFAAQALAEARALDASAAGLAEFAQRVGTAQSGSN